MEELWESAKSIFTTIFAGGLALTAAWEVTQDNSGLSRMFPKLHGFITESWNYVKSFFTSSENPLAAETRHESPGLPHEPPRTVASVAPPFERPADLHQAAMTDPVAPSTPVVLPAGSRDDRGRGW